MKVSKLALALVITLLGTPAAFAEFVEGTVNLEALRAQQSTPQSDTMSAVGNWFEGSMWEELRGQQQASVQERAKGMAGPAGPIAQEKAVSARGAEESIYETIRRDFH
jgi:hypothetical protein